jgi:hypothetical protein
MQREALPYILRASIFMQIITLYLYKYLNTCIVVPQTSGFAWTYISNKLSSLTSFIYLNQNCYHCWFYYNLLLVSYLIYNLYGMRCFTFRFIITGDGIENLQHTLIFPISKATAIILLFYYYYYYYYYLLTRHINNKELNWKELNYYYYYIGHSFGTEVTI